MRSSKLKFDRITRGNPSQLTIPRVQEGSGGVEVGRNEQYELDEAGKATGT